MRILLDECVHAGVKAAFPGHAVKTVSEAGLRGTKDRPLLAYAEDHFDVLITIDRNLERLKRRTLRLVVARVPNNEIGSYRPMFDALQQAAENVKPGEAIHVVSPQMRDARK